MGIIPASVNEKMAIRNLCFVLQEALNNAYRHGKATSFTVESTLTDIHLEIRFINNGKGFDQRNTSSGLGIKSMNHRIRSLKGHSTLTSSSQAMGVTQTIHLPLVKP